MIFRSILLILISCLAGNSSIGVAQEVKAAWVYFDGKDEVSLAPEKFYSPLALERRAALGLEPFEQTDLPVNKIYLKTLRANTNELIGSSRWLNAALVLATDDQLSILSSFPFVKFVSPSLVSNVLQAGENYNSKNDLDLDLVKKQLSWHEAELFRDNNLSGKGIRIAVFDGGFPGVDTHPGFKHLHQNNQIKGTWDFAKGSPDVYKFNNHGTAVLSCITGYFDDQATGMATNAEFLLARTELSGEPWKEELYWIQAAEWADKMGAHIISSSLGYTYHRYFIQDLTGKDTPVAIAANIAARKGILVINCIGNDGDKEWKYAVTPADADSVLSVGGIDPYTGIHIPFSSYGPNMSGDMKPNVVASGKVLAASQDDWKTAYGTSFSAPLIAGFAACAWQHNPGYSNMDIFDLIQQSGHLYPYYDFAHGYGIPLASKILSHEARGKDQFKNDFIVSLKPGEIEIEFTDSKGNQKHTSSYLYFNLRDDKNKIIRYGLYEIKSGLPVIIKIKESENIKSCYLRTEGSFQIIKI